MLEARLLPCEESSLGYPLESRLELGFLLGAHRQLTHTRRCDYYRALCGRKGCQGLFGIVGPSFSDCRLGCDASALGWYFHPVKEVTYDPHRELFHLSRRLSRCHTVGAHPRPGPPALPWFGPPGSGPPREVFKDAHSHERLPNKTPLTNPVKAICPVPRCGMLNLVHAPVGHVLKGMFARHRCSKRSSWED